MSVDRADDGLFERKWDAIQARMGEVVAGQLVVEQDGMPIRFYSDGETGRYLKSTPPAMAYEVVDDAYTPVGIGTQHGPAGESPLWVCWTRVKLHLWGESHAQTHEMRRRLIAAMHDEFRADNYRLENGAWHGRDVNDKGIAYVFVAAWASVITRVEASTTTVAISDFKPLGLEMKNPGDTLP